MIGKIAIIGATGIGDTVLYIVNEDEIVELSNEKQTVECGDLAIDAQECIEALEKVAVALSLSKGSITAGNVYSSDCKGSTG